MAADKNYRERRAVTRNRNDRQPDLFADRHGPMPAGTPAWSDLPPETRGILTRLMARLILEHAVHRDAGDQGGVGQQEAGHDL